MKWYGKLENLLDITPGALPDFYLVLSGPRAAPASSRGGVRPWCVESVHLFDAAALVATLGEIGVKVGVATSVRSAQWRAAELHPLPTSEAYKISDEQRALLQLFSIQCSATA